MTFLGKLDEMKREIAVRETCCGCRAGKAGLRVQITIKVDVDDPRLALRVEPEVDSAVVATLQRLERRQRDLDTTARDGRRELDDARGAVDALGRLGVPLRAVRDDARLVDERGAELNLGERQRATALVAQERHVDLPAVDVLLDERRLPEGPQHPADELPEARAIVNDRVEVDADRGVFT